MGGFSTAPLLIWQENCYRAQKHLILAHPTPMTSSSKTGAPLWSSQDLRATSTACVCHPGGVHDVATTFFSPLLGSLQLGLFPQE